MDCVGEKSKDGGAEECRVVSIMAVISKYTGFISHIHLIMSPKRRFGNEILRPTENGLDRSLARWMRKASDRKSERSSYLGELSALRRGTLHQEQVSFFGCFFFLLFRVSPERTAALYFSAASVFRGGT